MQPLTTAPPNAQLLIHGGGEVDDCFRRFATGMAATGKHAIVVASALSEKAEIEAAKSELPAKLAAFGVRAEALWVRHPSVADRPDVLARIRGAGGIWFTGGRQPLIGFAFRSTQALSEFHSIADAGGVIGGSSARATIQGSYMVRGYPQNEPVTAPPDKRDAFGFLRKSAIDQHVDTRHREWRVEEVLDEDEELLGIGLDEGTWIEVSNATEAIVHGRGRVLISDRQGETSRVVLRAGDHYDLGARRKLPRGGR